LAVEAWNELVLDFLSALPSRAVETILQSAGEFCGPFGSAGRLHAVAECVGEAFDWLVHVESHP